MWLRRNFSSKRKIKETVIEIKIYPPTALFSVAQKKLPTEVESFLMKVLSIPFCLYSLSFLVIIPIPGFLLCGNGMVCFYDGVCIFDALKAVISIVDM